VAIKSFEEIKRREFIAGAEVDSQAFKLEQSFADMNRMPLEELVDRLEQIDNQATLIKWRIWWAIRQKFPSDKLFGQYIAELRMTTHANCVGSQQEINRALNAGRFCEAHRITDLNSVGVLQSGIYELSRPVNDDIAPKIFRAVKNKGYPLAEIQRRIGEARAFLSVDRPTEIHEKPVIDETLPAEPREPYTVIVDKGIARIPEHAERFDADEMEMIQSIIEESKSVIIEHQAEDDDSDYVAPVVNHSPRLALLEALGNLDSSTVSDDQAIAEIKQVIGMYSNRPFIRVIGIYKALADWLDSGIKEQQAKGYLK
jgi:hypothetical protein